MLFEIIASCEYFAMLVMSVSLYVGLCAYAKGMVDDMRGQFTEINGHLLGAKKSSQIRTAVASTVIGEIRFHHKIIECVARLA